MPPDSLSQALQARHEATAIREAEMIQDWPIPEERQEQAEIYLRWALWERELGRIGDEAKRRIYATLRFAITIDAKFAKETKPLAELEAEADAEAAYFEQLDRRGCPECGDGICPVEDDRPTLHDQ